MRQNKKMRKLVLALMMIVAMGIGSVSVYADDSEPLSMTLKGGNDAEGVTLCSQEIGEEPYFLLPSGVKKKHMNANFKDGKVYKTAQSDKVGSVFFVSKDPVEKGMAYVNGSEDHSAKAKGMIYLYDETFNLVYSGEVNALKGRGNTTWAWSEKKPYQVKLEEKADLLNPVDGQQKNKTWILLSNPFDPTLIKNTMVYNFAQEIGLKNSPEGRAVDFYYDGIYRGSYYLCEKVEIGDGRVEIDDLEEAVEEANPDVEDMDELETATAKNAYGKEYAYVKGLDDPEDITGGYLLEADAAYYSGEKSWFNLREGHYWVSKSPEYLSKTMAEYISEHCQSIHDYIYGQRRQYDKGEDVFDYIDKESFVKYFITMEWFYNNDAWVSSSYFYKPAGDDKLYAGPVWDCDAIMGIKYAEKDPTGWKSVGLGRDLFGLPEFRKAVKETYVKEVRPVLEEILMGEGEGEYLKSYEAMKEEIFASRTMNDMLWGINDLNGTYFQEATVKANYKSLYKLMQQRFQWLDEQVMAEDFVKNGVKVNRAKVPALKANNKQKSIKVTITKTNYKVDNLVSSKTKKADNYQIAYRVKGTSKWKTVKTNGKLNYTLKKLKVGKTYQVKVRAIAKTSSGTKYGAYSKIKTVKIKKVK